MEKRSEDKKVKNWCLVMGLLHPGLLDFCKGLYACVKEFILPLGIVSILTVALYLFVKTIAITGPILVILAISVAGLQILEDVILFVRTHKATAAVRKMNPLPKLLPASEEDFDKAEIFSLEDCLDFILDNLVFMLGKEYKIIGLSKERRLEHSAMLFLGDIEESAFLNLSVPWRSFCELQKRAFDEICFIPVYTYRDEILCCMTWKNHVLKIISFKSETESGVSLDKLINDQEARREFVQSGLNRAEVYYKKNSEREHKP